jgi:hypothetical protein
MTLPPVVFMEAVFVASGCLANETVATVAVPLP